MDSDSGGELQVYRVFSLLVYNLWRSKTGAEVTLPSFGVFSSMEERIRILGPFIVILFFYLFIDDKITWIECILTAISFEGMAARPNLPV